MATVRFYGDLQRYGRKFKLDVLTAGEAIKALMVQLPGLRQQVQKGEYRVRIAGKDIYQDDLNTGMQSLLPDNAVIHLIPHLAGAKNGGILPIVMGVAMVVAAFWSAGASLTTLGTWGAMQGMLAASGAAMILSGTMMMLTKMPLTGPMTAEKSGNTAFSNLDNTVTQGQPIPLCYGEMMIGSKVLSQGVTTE